MLFPFDVLKTRILSIELIISTNKIWNMNYQYLIIYLSILLSSCSNKNDEEYIPPITIEGDCFSFVLNDGLQQSIIPSIQDKLEGNYSRVLADLEVDSMSNVTIKIWNNETHFLDDMELAIGRRYTGATGWVYSASDIRILYRSSNASQTALHEFCHAVSLVLNSTIGNNPRWLWEAVAIYEAGEYRDPKSLSYLLDGNFPTLSELSLDYAAGNHKIYEVGYLLAEYIITNWGKSGLVKLIQSNGNIQQTFNISTQQFEENWKNYIISAYFNK